MNQKIDVVFRLTFQSLVVSAKGIVLLCKFGNPYSQPLQFSLQSGFVGTETVVLCREIVASLLETKVVVLQLAVPLCKILDNDLNLEKEEKIVKM